MYIIICEYCSKEFTGRRNQKYCKDECRFEADKERKRKAYWEKHYANRVECNHCNKAFEPNENGASYKYCSDDCFKDYRRKLNRKLMRKTNPPKPDVTIICEQCGNKHTVSARTAHQARFCSEECNSRNKGHMPLDDWVAIRENRKRKRQVRLQRERAIRSLRTTLTRVVRHKEKQNRIKELTRDCEECGKEFYDPHPNTLTCSPTCSRTRGNRLQRLYMNSRYNDDNLIDTDITLPKLYERDKGVCHICNAPCDYDDMTITNEGHYIVGKTYPSIDHVIPISKQGKHKWSNVKLAHHYCNTIKRDNLIGNKGMEKTLV